MGGPHGERLFKYWEWRYLKFIHTTLTEHWHLVQGDWPESKLMWKKMFEVLELDDKAIKDIMLLAHSEQVGRAEANEILWRLLTGEALNPDYKDLSHLVTKLCKEAKKNIDGPPNWHHHNEWWSWEKYIVVRNRQFDPVRCPREGDKFVVITGEGGEPLEPPRCWKRKA